MKRPHSITIRDVARRAGVSTSTVSNVLNGRLDQMRSDTGERVKRAIARLGYTPTAAARQLKTGHSPVLGLVVPSVANPFWGALAQHVGDIATEHGYQVLLCNTERDAVLERAYLDAFWSHGARGVVLGSSSISPEHLQTLTRRGMRFVSFDRVPGRRESSLTALDSVTVDNAHGAVLAVRHLLELGHRRIGFISGPLRTQGRLGRLDGYRLALAEAGITPEPNLIWEGIADRRFGDVEGAELGCRAAHDLLRLSSPPTAVVAINDMYAFGAVAGAHELGLRVPHDLSVVGFDDIVLASITRPALTTVRQPLQALMRVAVELLVSGLARANAENPQRVVIRPELIIRESTAAPNASLLQTVSRSHA